MRKGTGFRRALGCVSITVVGALAGLQSVSAETLQEAMAAAYQSNPTLQAQRAAVRSDDEGVPQAKGGWRPTVELIGSLTHLQSRRNFAPEKSDRTNRTVTFRATQNVYAGGGTEAGIARAEADVLAERARLVDVEQTVLLNAGTAFMDVLRDSAVLELNIQNEKRLERQLEATRDRFEVGEVTRTDVAQAESRLARAVADRVSAKGTLETSKAVYEQIIGTVPLNLEEPELALQLPVSREETVTLASAHNPDLVAAERDRDSAVNDIKIQRADLLPSVDLQFDAIRDRKSAGDSTTSNELRYTANLTVPLYQAGVETSQVRAAKELAVRAADQIEEARRAAVEEATSSWEQHQTALAQIAAFEEQVRATTIALEGVEQEASVGSRTVLDVLDAEQELVDARVNLVRSKRDEVVARLQLQVATGSLTADVLRLDVDHYDATEHYNKVKDEAWGLNRELFQVDESYSGNPE